jgi:S-adenosylmethionine:tRNA ribosyltransferase-isomerase
LRADVSHLVLNHPRLVALEFDGTPDEIWEGLARYGRPIQYSHLPEPLALWDTWTPIAGPPVAFEPPSAGFMLDWTAVASMTARGVRFATLTHAAGISSTGDSRLDALLPFDEPYRIPASTSAAIAEARDRGGRIVAIGTTVVRALEHAAAMDGVVWSGSGLATNRIGASTRLHVVDAVFSGAHEPGTSHHELLRAFVDDQTLARIDEELSTHDYRTHEFGDSVFIERLTDVACRHVRSFLKFGDLSGGSPQTRILKRSAASLCPRCGCVPPLTLAFIAFQRLDAFQHCGQALPPTPAA